MMASMASTSASGARSGFAALARHEGLMREVRVHTAGDGPGRRVGRVRHSTERGSTIKRTIWTITNDATRRHKVLNVRDYRTRRRAFTPARKTKGPG